MKCISILIPAGFALALGADGVADGIRDHLRRQEPGTPAYNCHDNCGRVINMGRDLGDAACTNAPFLANYRNCRQCAGPDNHNLWTFYGNAVSNVGKKCSLPTDPLSGKQAEVGPALPATATTSTTPAPSPSTTSSVFQSSSTVATSMSPSQTFPSGTPSGTPGVTGGSGGTSSGEGNSAPPEPKPEPSNNTGSGITGGAIAGIVVGVLAGLALLGALIWVVSRRRRQRQAVSGPQHGMPELPGDDHGAARLPEMAASDADKTRWQPNPGELPGQTRAFEMHTDAPVQHTPELSASPYIPAASPVHAPVAAQETRTSPALPASMPPPWARWATPVTIDSEIPRVETIPAAQSQEQSHVPADAPAQQQPQSPPVLGESRGEEDDELDVMEAEAAQLEARRQRLLELDKVEEEQRQLRARIAAKRAGKQGGASS